MNRKNYQWLLSFLIVGAFCVAQPLTAISVNAAQDEFVKCVRITLGSWYKQARKTNKKNGQFDPDATRDALKATVVTFKIFDDGAFTEEYENECEAIGAEVLSSTLDGLPITYVYMNQGFNWMHSNSTTMFKRRTTTN